VFDGYWNFIPAEPEVYIEPDEEVNCIVGESVTYSVVVHNITKMKSLHFDLRWKGNYIAEEDIWWQILNLTEVVINEDVFPKANRSVSSIVIKNTNKTSKVVVDIEMECDFPLINGTELKAVDLIFTKMDPWYCGRQPNYTREKHVWTPENATTRLWFCCGWIDVMCPEKEFIAFGEAMTCEDYCTYGADLAAYTQPTSCDDTIYGWETIQSDIDSATAGDVLCVVDGSWTEDFTINKDDITLSGAGATGTTTIIGTVTIKAKNVILEGFKIIGHVSVWGYDNVTVRYNNVTYSSGNGIVYSHTGSETKGGTIDNNVVLDNYSPGGLAIYCDHDDVLDFLVIHNTVENARKAIGFGSLSGGVIMCNEIINSSTYDIEIFDGSEAAVNYNKLSGIVKNYGGGTLDAEYNRWGDADPSDQVEGPVDYIPWIFGASCHGASYDESTFTFMPVSGDLTGDGAVDIEDLTIICAKYCKTWTTMPKWWWTPADYKAWGAVYYYDFNKDKHIDIFDIIVVTKNFGAECPF
jgi:hypothetical protein